MLKSLCLGVGIFLLVLGLSLHAVDSYTYTVRPSETAQGTGVWYDPIQPMAKTVVLEPWEPWAYMDSGIVLILWTCTLSARMDGK